MIKSAAMKNNAGTRLYAKSIIVTKEEEKTITPTNKQTK